MYLGIDGCRGGWLAATIDDAHELSFQILSRLNELTVLSTPFLSPNPSPRVTLIDIPLGFPEKEPRRCDRETRKLLGPQRGPSVFFAPVQSAVYAKTYRKACEENKKSLGKKISIQTWNICGKVREANEFLERMPPHQFPKAPDEKLPFPALREAHPELCFLGWSGGPCSHNKKTPEGFAERIEIITHLSPDFPSSIDEAISRTPRRLASPDDFLDAAILAITATKYKALTSVPDLPDYDNRGQKREIVYYKS